MDIFGYSEERREERETLREYKLLIKELKERLSKENFEIAIELVRLPEQIRGYGHVKSKNLARVNVRKTQLLKQLRGEVVNIVNIENVAA